jgi:hypothetical protein
MLQVKIDFSALHKSVVAIKILAYERRADSLNEHLKMGESTILYHEGMCF